MELGFGDLLRNQKRSQSQVEEWGGQHNSLELRRELDGSQLDNLDNMGGAGQVEFCVRSSVHSLTGPLQETRFRHRRENPDLS
jgi:hypothetical protein